jgi:outer membrane protein assembly factor BamB
VTRARRANHFALLPLALLLMLSLAACSSAPVQRAADTASGSKNIGSENISSESISIKTGGIKTIIWSGEVLVNESITFPRATKLVIMPGTTIRFADTDEDGDGWGDVSITFEGELTAKGTPEDPIVFTTQAPVASPGMWGELRIDFGKVDISYAVFEGSTRGLHLHFTGGRVSDSIFRANVDGTRLGESRLEFTHCLFADNSGKGFNARASTLSLTRSWFRGNRKGIFLFEGDKGSEISQNLFTGNETPFRLGDFYEGTVSLNGNQWEKPPLDFRAEGNEAALLTTAPSPVDGVGPRRWPLLRPAWEHAMEGYVDADPTGVDLGIYVADWAGNIARLGFLDGKVNASAKMADAVDAQLAVGRSGNRTLAAAVAWDRSLTLLDAVTLEVLDRFVETPSPADDHRQAAPLIAGGRLYAATWAGRVRAFDLGGAKLIPLWTFSSGAPFRGELALSDDGTLLAPCQNGTLYALDAESGKLLWSSDSDEPLISGPVIADVNGTNAALTADRGGALVALSLEGGEVLWRAALCGPSWYAPVVVVEEQVVKGQAVEKQAIAGDDEGCLSSFNLADGRARWSTQLAGAVRSKPALVAGQLVVGTLAGPNSEADSGASLYLIDAASGFVRDRLKVGDAIHTSPAVMGSRLIFGSRDAVVRAVDVITVGGEK